MLEDTLGGMEDEEEMEEEAEAEVDRILFEVTAGKEPHDLNHPGCENGHFILTSPAFSYYEKSIALAQNISSLFGLG